jgi:hypothetical protein
MGWIPDLRSRIRKKLIPDPGSGFSGKKVPDFESATLMLGHKIRTFLILQKLITFAIKRTGSSSFIVPF